MDEERILLSLDGTWQVALDPEDVGKIEQWCEGMKFPDARPVTVPGVWDLCAPGNGGAACAGYGRAFGALQRPVGEARG